MSTFRGAFRRFVLLGGALAAVAFASRPAAADDQLTVVAGAQPTAFYQVIDHVAIRGGFYKAEHLDVTEEYAGNPVIAAQLLASGKGDISAEALEPLIQGYDKGVHLVAFFARSPRYQYALGVLDSSPIRTLADFKGATIGEYSPGNPGEYSTSSLLEGAGLKRSDFSFIPIGNGAQAIQAMTSGKVAGAAFPYLELLIYEVNAGQKYRLFHHPILADIVDTGFVTTPAMIANKPDILRRFSRAVAKASILVRVNPQLAARYYLEGSGQKVTPEAIANETKLFEVAADQLPGYYPLSKRIGDIPEAGMGVLAKFLYDAGVVNEVLPTSTIMTDQFIDYANDFDHKAFVAQAKLMH
jgi:NitT/TauT family transport system substrate-binding protein